MANVIIKILGSKAKDKEFEGTLGELKEDLGIATYTAMVNKESESNDYEVQEDDSILFTPPVKGA